MLVEQLILRSYAIHLEKEAALQMEQLLLEVSLEDKAKEHNASASCSKKKSKKKKKRKKAAGNLAPQPDTTRDQAGHVADNADRSEALGDPNGDVMDEPAPEPTPKLKSVDSDCQSNSSTAQSDEIVVEENEATPAAVESFSKKSTGLNPNAVAFQPQENVIDSVDSRNPFAGKRKFDEYIVSVPWEDVESEADSAFDTLSFDSDFSDREEVVDFGDSQQWRRKQRRHEEDAELEWQLQQVYASTSSLFGWDFSRQCELPTSGANLPWSESMLWRTAPKEVVRYFSSGNRDAYSRFHAPQFLPPSACLPPSRYYFHPGSSVPFGPPLLAPPAMESIPQHLHSTFGFQSPEFPMVVSSPDFSNAQYHSNNHEDQVDV
ncbi:hypothetical protein DVH05_013878 [Phytophthora capsici]|nr:hypothetical protein DVH05_013878 [Phytophthora capsici]